MPNNYNNNTFQRSVQYHYQIARQKRHLLFKRLRQQYITQKQQSPINSSVLQKYWDIPASKLYLYLDQIYETLDDLNGQQLSEQDHYDFCQDLLYFFMNHQENFILPYTFKFLKDNSHLTATVAAHFFSSLMDQEALYWLGHMDEQLRNMIYLQSQCDEPLSLWYENPKFTSYLLQDWQQIQQAQQTILVILQQNRQQLSQQFIQLLFQTLFLKNKSKLLKPTSTLFSIIIQLIFYCLGCVQNKQITKKLTFLKILLNEMIIKILLEEENQFQLKFSFLIKLDLLNQSMYKEKHSFCLSEEAFLKVLKVLIYNYEKLKENQHLKGSNIFQRQSIQLESSNPIYIQNRSQLKLSYDKSFKKDLQTNSSNQNVCFQSQTNLIKVQESYLEKIINFSLNQMRLNALYHVKFVINNDLIARIRPREMIGKNNIKLILNSVKPDDNIIVNKQREEYKYKNSKRIQVQGII